LNSKAELLRAEACLVRSKQSREPAAVSRFSHPDSMTTEQQLREKLRKITALFEGATTAGERQAAAAAIERVRQALDAAVRAQPLPETKFSLPDQWQRRLFVALCRRYGLEPYRYKGQRYTTVIVRAPASFVEKTLWPEYIALQRALHSYLNEATERIIREEVWKDAGEPAERTGTRH
jgi:hypothetical protein